MSATPLSDAPSLPARAGLLTGLTWQRVASVTAIALVVAASMVWFFDNELPDLVISTLCVGYTTMLLFTVAGNLPVVRSGRIAREAAQIVAVIAGSALGTVVTGVVKGRPLSTLLDERLSGFVATSGLGIGFGSVVVALYFYRERNARMRAELAALAAQIEAARAKEDQQLLVARLQLLQAQVEPHFLFNTLACVQHLTETDPARASAMLGSLIRYLRAALPRMRGEASTVGREVAMVEAYLEVQRVRMGDRLAFDIAVPDALADRSMPPMMLICLVENAIEHGIETSTSGGRIAVEASGDADATRVAVVDNGSGLSETAGIGIGLGNVRERLSTLYGSAAKLDLHENPAGGVIAGIEWPVAAALMPSR